MKRLITNLLLIATILVVTPAFAGIWYQCDDLSIRYKGKKPPSANISWGANTSPQEYADLGNWCTARALQRPSCIDGDIWSDMTLVLNYPYVDLTWTCIPDPNPDIFDLKAYKIQKGYEVFNTYVKPLKDEDCIAGDFTVTKEIRVEILENIGLGLIGSYLVMNNVTGYPEKLTKSVIQAKTVLTGCKAKEDAALAKFFDDHPDTPEVNDGLITQIFSCPDTGDEIVDKACVDLRANSWFWPEDDPGTT